MADGQIDALALSVLRKMRTSGRFRPNTIDELQRKAGMDERELRRALGRLLMAGAVRSEGDMNAIRATIYEATDLGRELAGGA